MIESFPSFHIWFSAVATFITAPIGIATFCAIIVLWTLHAYWLGFKQRILPLVLQLEDAYFKLERCGDTADFAENYHEFDAAIMRNPLLADAWREFSDTLLFPSSDEVQHIQNVQSPAHFFRRDALLVSKLNLRLYNAVPNLLTGAGILGTFIGLVAGIYLASGNLASSDIAQARQAMGQLLHGASLAFITSIFGLLSSIIFSWREKHWVHRFDSVLGRWVAELERRLRRITPEELARDQLQQTTQQTGVMEGFTEQLAFQIAEAFDQKLQQHLTDSVAPALDTLVTEIQGLRADRQNSDENILMRLVTEFTDKLSGAAGSEMQALATTLEGLNGQLQAQTTAAEEHHQANQEAARQSIETLGLLFRRGTEDFQNRVGESVDTITERFGGLLERLSERQSEAVAAAATQMDQVTDSVRSSIEETVGIMSTKTSELLAQFADQQQRADEDANQRIRTMSDAFKEAAGTLDRTLNEFRGINDSNRAMMDQTTALATTLGAAVETVEGLSAPIEGAAGKLEQTGEQLLQLINTMEIAVEPMQKAVERLDSASGETREAWVDYQQRFQGIDEALANAFTELNNGVQQYTTQINDFVVDLDKHSADIVGKLGAATEGLTEAIEELNDSLSMMERTT